MYPRFFCTAVTVVVGGKAGKKQEQVQLRRLSGDARVIVSGSSLLLIHDVETDFGQFEPGRVYESQFLLAPIDQAEVDAIIAKDEEGARDLFEEVLREAASMFRTVNEQLTARVGATGREVPITGTIPSLYPSGVQAQGDGDAAPEPLPELPAPHDPETEPASEPPATPEEPAERGGTGDDTQVDQPNHPVTVAVEEPEPAIAGVM